MGMTDLDITDNVDFGYADEESLPLRFCVCGAQFELWTQVLGIYRDKPWTCPKCARKLYFGNYIKVYQVVEP
jgi:hypothetical protein